MTRLMHTAREHGPWTRA